MSAGLVASTVTPGTMAPDVSVTWPAIAPRARGIAGNSRTPRAIDRGFLQGNPRNIRRMRIASPHRTRVAGLTDLHVGFARHLTTRAWEGQRSALEFLPNSGVPRPPRPIPWIAN